jgi:16S rRNA (uracil1498-N3)-methyltransferase
MPKFFVSKESIENNIAKIEGKDAFHIARSLRMAVGDNIYVSDGEGHDYLAALTDIKDDICTAEILSEGDSAEPKMNITLYMAYPKGDKLETVIQKAVELGVTRIVPFESSRCIKRPKADKVIKQGERLSKIAEEAAKQSGRGIIPEVALPLSYSEMLEDAKSSALRLICYEKESDLSVKALLSQGMPESIAIIVGCEGGFSPEEVEEAVNSGCHSVTLGKRILRCETAPLAVLSMILYQYEL